MNNKHSRSPKRPFESMGDTIQILRDQLYESRKFNAELLLELESIKTDRDSLQAELKFKSDIIDSICERFSTIAELVQRWYDERNQRLMKLAEKKEVKS